MRCQEQIEHRAQRHVETYPQSEPALNPLVKHDRHLKACHGVTHLYHLPSRGSELAVTNRPGKHQAEEDPPAGFLGTNLVHLCRRFMLNRIKCRLQPCQLSSLLRQVTGRVLKQIAAHEAAQHHTQCHRREQHTEWIVELMPGVEHGKNRSDKSRIDMKRQPCLQSPPSHAEETFGNRMSERDQHQEAPADPEGTSEKTPRKARV